MLSNPGLCLDAHRMIMIMNILSIYLDLEYDAMLSKMAAMASIVLTSPGIGGDPVMEW